MSQDLTPTQIVQQLDRHIVGQEAAKRAVAVAMRSRWRRRQLPAAVAREVHPHNIIMMGPTGCGKTEIARRLAQLTNAPFVKVEATKFTEVGYHGRDVDTMVRDLLDQSIQLVRREHGALVREKAKAEAVEQVLEILFPSPHNHAFAHVDDPEQHAAWQMTRDNIEVQLRAGELDGRLIELTTTEKSDVGGMMSGMGLDQFGPGMSDMLEKMMPSKQRQRKMAVAAALRHLEETAIESLLDQDAIIGEAVRRAEEDGIIFIDEVDKIAMGEKNKGSDAGVSRQGVQRDLLPIVEGSVINTRHGAVKTDHILFIAAGAFHVAKVSDLMPELQGRFPIRVELEPLTRKDFVHILADKENALPAQQQALLQAEGLAVSYDRDAIETMADLAWKANNEGENIGARRLMTIVEKVFEVVNFEADAMVAKGQARLNITERYVREQVEGAAGKRGWFKL